MRLIYLNNSTFLSLKIIIDTEEEKKNNFI